MNSGGELRSATKVYLTHSVEGPRPVGSLVLLRKKDPRFGFGAFAAKQVVNIESAIQVNEYCNYVANDVHMEHNTL
jgi:hypothetical protein